MKKELHHKIINSLPFPFYLIEAESFKVLKSNDPNFTENQLCWDLIPGCNSGCKNNSNTPCPIKKVLKERKPIQEKLEHVTKDGICRSFIVHANPLFDDNGKISHIVQNVVDISETESLKEKINCNQKDLNETIKELSLLNQQLEQVNSKYISLFENSPESLWEEDFTQLMESIHKLKNEGISDFEKFFDENPEILLDLSRQVEIVNVNQATLKLYKAESKIDLLGNLEKTFLPESLSVFKKELLSIINGENNFSREARVKTLKGDVIHVIIKLFHTKQLYSDKFFAYVSTTDITEQKKYESALYQSHETFKKVMDNINALIYVADMESYEILFMNKRMRESLGAIQTKKCYETIQKGQTKPCDFCTNPLIFKDGKAVGIHNWEFQNTINNKWYYISDMAIEWIDGKIVRFEIATDISDLKEIDLALKLKNEEYQKINEELQITNKEFQALNNEYQLVNSNIIKTNIELEKARKKAIESDQLKSAFLSNMSHEIRTPMNTIIGFSDLLSDPLLPQDKRQKFINLIQTSGEHLLRIIDDIIDVSKIESNQLRIESIPCNVNQLLNDIRDSHSMLKILKNQGDVLFRIQVPHDSKNISVYCDPTRFRQIIYNLVSNAFKYTKNGFVEIGYNVITESNMVHFYVKDTGIGISSEMFQFVFDRFRQIENENLQEGTGLGLSITKALVNLLGGEIWLDSEINIGTTFHFTIPAFGQEIPAFEEPKNQSTIENIDLSNFLIYVAEDDISSYLLIEELLTDTKVRLRHVTNGYDLIKLIELKTPDLILLDINMPEMNGYATISKIREKFPRIPVIAQTAYAMTEEKEKCLASGCNDYISKPIDTNLFMRKIQHFLIKGKY